MECASSDSTNRAAAGFIQRFQNTAMCSTGLGASPQQTARQNSVVSFSIEGFVKKSSAFDTTVKFWSGTIVGIILSIACLFNKNPNGKTTIGFFFKNNLMICIVCLIMGAVFGWLFTLIPTLGSVWINAIAAPIVQFVFLDLLISTPQKKK